MKVSKHQLRRLIKEEKRKLHEQPFNQRPPPIPSLMPNDLAQWISTAWEEDYVTLDFEGTGPTWSKETQVAASELERALQQPGVLRAVLDVMTDVEERLHNGEFA